MKYFTIAELSRSAKASSLGIDNTPPAGVTLALTALVDKVLDPVRSKYSRPITVNSGYRSLKLNQAVGGAATSQHLRGEAADITAGSKAENRKLFAILETMAKAGEICFDQLIDEKAMTWIHISYRADGRNRNQKLKL